MYWNLGWAYSTSLCHDKGIIKPKLEKNALKWNLSEQAKFIGTWDDSDDQDFPKEKKGSRLFCRKKMKKGEVFSWQKGAGKDFFEGFKIPQSHPLDQ